MQFTADHESFRQAARGVLGREVTPHAQEWEEAGSFPAHQLFKTLGTAGLLGLEYDPAYGGQGADHSYTVILGEELGRMGCAGVAMAIAVQNDMATPSLHSPSGRVPRRGSPCRSGRPPARRRPGRTPGRAARQRRAP